MLVAELALVVRSEFTFARWRRPWVTQNFGLPSGNQKAMGRSDSIDLQ